MRAKPSLSLDGTDPNAADPPPTAVSAFGLWGLLGFVSVRMATAMR